MTPERLCYRINDSQVLLNSIGDILVTPANAFLLFQPVLMVICAVVWIFIASPVRRKRELRRQLLRKRYPAAFRHCIVLPLQSSFRGEKQREIDACIEQMRMQGWVFFGLEAVSPLISLWHWGGAVRIEFLEVRHGCEA